MTSMFLLHILHSHLLLYILCHYYNAMSAIITTLSSAVQENELFFHGGFAQLTH